jgi:hypothetical protein
VTAAAAEKQSPIVKQELARNFRRDGCHHCGVLWAALGVNCAEVLCMLLLLYDKVISSSSN